MFKEIDLKRVADKWNEVLKAVDSILYSIWFVFITFFTLVSVGLSAWIIKDSFPNISHSILFLVRLFWQSMIILALLYFFLWLVKKLDLMSCKKWNDSIPLRMQTLKEDLDMLNSKKKHGRRTKSTSH